jgi:hypothetical protein
MKKLLIFMLVLGMASMAVAVPVFRVDPCDRQDNYEYSDVITIQLVDTNVLGFSIDAIVDVICPTGGIAGGTAAEPQVFNAGFGAIMPGALDVNAHLVDYMFASVTSLPPVAVSGVLYSFEYHVPDVPFSTLICIDSFAGGEYWSPLFQYSGAPDYEGPVTMLTCIHVVPEPATMLLLGLGGLLLRRRKKQQTA